MTPQEALNLLDQASSQLNANREIHVKLARAVATLQQVLQSPVKEEEKKDE